MNSINKFVYRSWSYLVDKDAYVIFIDYDWEEFWNALFYDEDSEKKMELIIYNKEWLDKWQVSFMDLKKILEISQEEFEYIRKDKKIKKKLF